jgi:hypothetical protein
VEGIPSEIPLFIAWRNSAFEVDGRTATVGSPEVILGRHLLAGMSEFFCEISTSQVKHRIDVH